MRHQVITASTLGQTLAYAEAVCASRNFHLFHGIEDRRVDFRVVTARLIDLGAPIADWRNDPRALAIDISHELPVYYEGDTRRYGGVEAEALNGIRNEYWKPLVGWLMMGHPVHGDRPPVPLDSDEGLVCAWLIQLTPTVEEFVDYGMDEQELAA